ncbi:MAG: HD-GYP domain-containing protein [Candidatus Micrarchaeota archaeon]|nr:HD-GYP domain-containing protein [Candidatus Micrarchaeota archaeon]
MAGAHNLFQWIREAYAKRKEKKRHRKEALKAFRKMSNVAPVTKGTTSLEESRRISYELNKQQLAYALKSGNKDEALATLIDIGELASRDPAIASDWEKSITDMERSLIRKEIIKYSLPRFIRRPIITTSEILSSLGSKLDMGVSRAYLWLLSLTSIPSWAEAHARIQEAYKVPSEENIRKAGIQNVVAVLDSATAILLCYFAYDFVRDLHHDVFALKAAGALTMRAVVHKAALGLLAKSAVVVSVDAFKTSERKHVENDLIGMRSVEVALQALGQKDEYTLGHTERVSEYSEWIARDIGLPEREVLLVKHAAKLHDLGKIGMPDSILFKNGRLTDEEFEQVKMHPLRGYTLAVNFTKLDEVLLGILMHHEKLNGKGYYGVKGDEIPLTARIISIADIYDALRTNRPYQKGRSHDEAVSMLKDFAAKGEIDSSLVDVFIHAYGRRMGTIKQEF